jgi:YbbR domain-containing protein
MTKMGWLTRNFWWKLGALALSAVLWFTIVGEPEMVTTRSMPILYKDLPGDLLIGQTAIDTVQVELRGPAGRLTAATLSELAVVLDLSGVTGPGERTFTLSDADFRLPDGVVAVRAIPSQLRMKFSRKKSKNVPVEVRIGAGPSPGYEVVRHEATPATVQIAGPEGRVDAIQSAQTDAIDLAGLTGPVEVHVNTYVADPQVWLESPASVRVNLTVEKRGK